VLLVPAIRLWLANRSVADSTCRWARAIELDLLKLLTVGGGSSRWRFPPHDLLLAGWIVAAFVDPVLGLLILLLVDRSLESGVGACHAARPARGLASEAKAFDDLAHACRSDGLRAIYRGFIVQRRRTACRDGLAPFAETPGSVLYAAAAWSAGDGRLFFQSLRALPHRSHRVESALPPLNPQET
jgi:hypothetical protein